MPNCDQCPLRYKSPGVSPKGETVDTDIMIIGEAPAYNEVEQNKPFVGRAGQLLDKVIKRAGLDAYRLYFTNVVKCHPTQKDFRGRDQTRTPDEKEVECCVSRLAEEIITINPKIIVPVGGIAMTAVLSSKLGILSKRGILEKLKMSPAVTEPLKNLGFPLPEIPVLPTVHPAYVLRNPGAEPKMLEDFDKVKAILSGKANKVDWECVILDTFDKVTSWADTMLKDYSDKKFKGMAYDIETSGLEAFKKDSIIYSIQFSCRIICACNYFVIIIIARNSN